jgi:MYXO-CTERM domain-containing protein
MVGPDGLLVRPGALGWTPESVTFPVPPATAAGWYTLSASVNGIEGNAQPFAVGQGLGQACDAGSDCVAGACAGGTCTAPPEIIWVPPDAGADAGADAGMEAGSDGGADAGPPWSFGIGCGCTAAPGAWAALLLLVAGLGYRRRSLNARSRVPSALDDVTHSSISGST